MSIMKSKKNEKLILTNNKPEGGDNNEVSQH